MDAAEKVQEILDHNIKKEYAVLACLLNVTKLGQEYNLDIDCFNNEVTRNIFKVYNIFKEQYELGKINSFDIDIIKAEDIVKQNNIDLSIKDLSDCKSALNPNSPICLDNLSIYIDDLKNMRTRMRIYNAAQGIIDADMDIKKDPSVILMEAMDRIAKIEDSDSVINEPLQISFGADKIDEKKNVKTSGWETGFEEIDLAIDGLQRQSLTVIGARAKVGKSAFGLNVALNIMEKYGNECPVLYFDSEMSLIEQQYRCLSILSRVPERHIKHGTLNDAELARVLRAKEKMKKMPFYHLYSPAFTVDGIISLSRRMKNKKGIGLLIYDYIKLPDSSDAFNKNMQEYQILGILTNALKNKIAGALNIAALTFGQLNREGVKQATSGEVDETSIGGSDRIIQYCSNYMVLRKTPENELTYQPKPTDPEWKKMGKFGNRMMHMCCTRNGGDSGPPVPIFYEDYLITMREAKKVRDAAIKDGE